MFDLIAVYHWLAKWPITFLFKVLIDRRVTLKNVEDGEYNQLNEYYDNYSSYNMALLALENSKSRIDFIVTKLIALTQIHGIAFAVVALVASFEKIDAGITVAVCLFSNITSILLVIFGLSIKKSFQLDYSILSGEEKLSTSEIKEFNVVISHNQVRADFLADMFKLAQGFLLTSIAFTAFLLFDPMHIYKVKGEQKESISTEQEVGNLKPMESSPDKVKVNIEQKMNKLMVSGDTTKLEFIQK